jgi:PleD family two-component response regulator
MMKTMRYDSAAGGAYNILVASRRGTDLQHVNVTGSRASRRVLVVEDDPDIGRLIVLQLAELGCESQLIDDGVTALAEAQATHYDLVILDV